MKKNLLKTTTAAALLTSSILAFSPVVYGKTTNLDQSVNAVKTELNKITIHYVAPSLNGKLAPSSALYPALNSAKKNYQTTRSAVASSKLSSSQKQAKLNELDALYTEKVSKGMVPYIDAYNYANKYLTPIMNEIKAAEAKNDFAAVEKGYHKLSYQLKGRTSILYRFSGKAARDLLLEQYKKPADAKRNELMVPVTISMKITSINSLLAAGKKEEAKKAYAEIEALVKRLPNAATNTYVSALLKEVEKVKVAVHPDASTVEAQKALDIKVASLITGLNAKYSEHVTASTSATNTLTVTINKDQSIADFLGKGFYSAFIKELGVKKINGHNPDSIEAIKHINSLLPANATTLNDLKEKTISLPLTINNGVELPVTFSISFK